jgi:hypothetical protein
MHLRPFSSSRLLGSAIALVTSVAGVSLAYHVFAAEQILFRYQAIRETLSVRELTTFATTGTASPKLDVYLTLSQSNRSDIRKALTNPISVSPAMLNQFLDSWVGKLVLDELSQIVQTPSGRSNKQALRSAIATSVQRDNQFTLLEVFQNYPNAQIEIDIDRLIETNKRINSNT